MSDYAIAIIDGTGDWNDEDYAISMKRSFCSQIKTRLGDRCEYKRGPSFEGYRMNERGVWAAKKLMHFAESGATRLFLAGYSRGAVAAIMAAEELAKEDIAVAGMFLFDPVERHLSSGGNIIPSNVGDVYVARRAYTAAMVKKYDWTIGAGIPMIGRLFYHNPLRTSFGFARIVYNGSGT